MKFSPAVLDKARTLANAMRATDVLASSVGEGGEAIAAYLSPVDGAPTVDVSACPDCRGTGFWYPDGQEKGVAKCKHARLKEEKPQT